MSTAKPLNVVLLAPPESSAAALFGMYDLFCSAGRDWPLITEGKPGPALIACQIVSRDGQGFRSGNGAWIQPDADLNRCHVPDVICIPDLMVMPGESISGRHHLEIAWLKKHYERGTIVATACTGALMLAEAGLLDGKSCTTHWAYCDAMSKDYPRVNVLADRAMVVDGEGQRLLMAGGGTSWLDLALLVIARQCGTEEAMHVARMHLIDWHQHGQQPYAALTRPRHTEDALIANCQVWVAQNYEQEAPVTKMAAMSGLSDRAFARRFAKATGMSPLEYVHSLRLEEAKQVLEATNDPIEEIANEVGYEDASFFGRLFRRKVGLTPTQYRKRFGSLRKSLNSVAVSN